MKKTLGSLILLLSSYSLTAADWTQWRGPNFDGSAAEATQSTNFSKTKNVKWSADMPGPAGSTPIIYGDKVFVSSVDESTQKLVGLCLDKNTGKVVWKKDLGGGYKPAGAGTEIALGTRSNYASPSPLTDGKNVIFFYGNGDFRWFRHGWKSEMGLQCSKRTR